MIRINFLLKKSGTQETLESMSISEPKKITEGKNAGQYFCKFVLPGTREGLDLYSINPVDTLLLGLESMKVYLQASISKGSVVKDPETKEPWDIEKKSLEVILQEKIDGLKNNQQIPLEKKEEIYKIIKTAWGGDNSPIKSIIEKLNW